MPRTLAPPSTNAGRHERAPDGAVVGRLVDVVVCPRLGAVSTEEVAVTVLEAVGAGLAGAVPRSAFGEAARR